ncbi:bifunctional METTL16-RlmF family/S-adenosyl-L-methionine-dependent methyltransferase superfamily/Ribosomal RNA large subunit methyltransferase F [Babesia duncani]|uniref:Bifunctional METTL16-RlmF family/S-adenosyl-L-methionine-dependent methyltransferase superfamily/Ribosomal RNA large subunit methyltransferase F n=1 Tax=Babesia duncani TaxID=323732 RepID=A0AAD9UNX4_9APIC|nr:bifunctional METTL16-RlmF family/S-adenosyl-L-methionine-dependent methyltransferase superfamily/Ribosomal RNA large subunit methyltransferase F [Babesia duncani]
MILNLKWKPSMPNYKMYHYNFNHPDAVYHLSKAILKKNYNLDLQLPCACTGLCSDEEDKSEFVDRFLAPCIPNRADYIHYLADLLNNPYPEMEGQNKVENYNPLQPVFKNSMLKILDIGTGANVIYPLLGNAEYKWKFVATDISPEALQVAHANISLNGLTQEIELRQQYNHLAMFSGVMKSHERFMASICNPPFHHSLHQINSNPKVSTLGRKEELLFTHFNTSVTYSSQYMDQNHKQPLVLGHLGYTFTANPLDHGELAFIEIMFSESRFYAHNVVWFTSLVARATTLKRIKNTIHSHMRMYQMDNKKQVEFIDAVLGQGGETKVPCIQVENMHVSQFRVFVLGRKKLVRWLICWSFMNTRQCHRALYQQRQHYNNHNV